MEKNGWRKVDGQWGKMNGDDNVEDLDPLLIFSLLSSPL
jgi:hypothetical protein